MKSLEDYIENMKAGDSELLQKITAMEAQTVADRKEYESQVREVRAEHGKEIEEMLSQLDLVEAEADQRYTRSEKVVIAKDAVISALGSQLAEAQTRLNNFTERHDSISRELEATHEETQFLASEIEKKSQAIQRMKVAHQQALENELVLREKTCEDAREEMIARAEQQFDQANATYKKLKQEYDTAIVKLSCLEKDLKVAKKEVHEAKKKQESREFDLADKLAQAKASIATVEASASRKAYQYRYELEAANEAEKEIRHKLDEALSTSRSVQSTLASVVAEKERMIAENVEMKAVCEELMAMVEG